MKPLRVGKDINICTSRLKTLLENGPVGQRRQDHAGLHGRAPDCQDKGSDVSEISAVALAFSQYRTAHAKWNFIESLIPNSAFLLHFLF